MTYADVVFNLALPKTFTYRMPAEVRNALQPGQRVLVPFGKRELTGIVTRVFDYSDLSGCKEIVDVLEEIPLVRPELLEFTAWLAEYYLCPWGQTIQLTLPRGLEQKSESIIRFKYFPEDKNLILSERQQHLLDLIAGNSGKSTIYYRRQFGSGSFYHYLHELHTLGLIQVEQRIKKPARPQEQRFVSIHKTVKSSDRILKKHPHLNRVLQEIKGKTLLFSDFKARLDLSPAVINRLGREGILTIERRQRVSENQSPYPEEKKWIVPNAEQQAALAAIKEFLRQQEFHVFLLYGITGSGKTQVYLEAIKICVYLGRTAIVLIPEISLTPQTVQRFENFFPGQVAVFHSKMSVHDRYATWMKVYHREVSIVVGPRSALFMPVQNLGIIVVDEEHDGSYKQNDPAPRYHARDAAIYRARMNRAVVILGSATPSLESYYNACQHKYTMLELTKRINNVHLPRVYVQDSKSLLKGGTESRIFTPLLLEKIKQCLERKEQIILLQNRRGFAAYLQCRECGYIFLCPNCEITLTFHAQHKNLLCHYCGYSKQAPEYCPKCQGESIKYLGVGTQKIQAEVLKLFANVRLIRMDQDTTVRKGSHDSFLKSFKEGRADILLGTQMISKGLDFSRVTLVGVISADIGLSWPDYRASERVFQLLTQVAGRAGRDVLAGEVVIQSNVLNHYAIQFAKNHDYKGFYQQEIKYRRELGYPPFRRIINIKFSADNLTKTIAVAREISLKLRKSSRGLYEIIGPAPSAIAKINKQYRWQTLLKINPLKDPAGKHAKKIITDVLSPYLHQKESNLKIITDIDPLEIL
jgi:primosomal protein N' (replication factor Y)